MKAVFIALLALLAASAIGRAANPVLRFPDGGPAYYLISEYGAICDGTAAHGDQDTAAINQVFAAIRALPNNTTHPYIVFPGNPSGGSGTCYITSTINATSAGGGADALSSVNHLTVQGGRLECHTTGTPCVDMSGGRYYEWQFTVINSPPGPDESSYGLQIARLQAGQPAGDHFFNHLIVQGFYTKAAVISFASEINVWIQPAIANNDTLNATSNYTFIDDGCNHFGLHSQFTNIAIPINTPTSDLDDIFIGGQITSGAGGHIIAPLFLCHTLHHEYRNMYLNSNSDYAVHYFGLTNGNSEMTDLDVHIETGGLVKNAVLFENNSGRNQVINGFRLRDSALNASESIFAIKKDAGGNPTLDSVTIHNFDVEIGRFSQGNSVKLFDDGTRYAVDGGTIRIPRLANWVLPTATANTNTSEIVCIADQLPICQTPTPTVPLNRNPDFAIDQPNEGAANLITSNGAIVIDGWHEANSGVLLSSLTFQRTPSSGSPNNFPFLFSLETTVTATKTPGPAEYYRITQNIEGANTAPLRWGLGSQAVPVVLDYCLNSSVAPVTIPFAITNVNQDRSFVIDNVLATTGWHCFSTLVPPDQFGGWAKTQNAIGMKLHMAYGFGSTVVGSCVANVWQDGACFATANSTQFISQPNGSTLDISYVHLFNSFISNPELTEPYALQLQLAQRWYQKSFRVGVKPAQNAGADGALTMQAPFAQATFPNLSTFVPLQQMFNNGGLASPVVTFFSPSAASSNCYNATAAAPSGAASASVVSDRGMTVQCTLAVGGAIGDQIQVHYTADSGL